MIETLLILNITVTIICIVYFKNDIENLKDDFYLLKNRTTRDINGNDLKNYEHCCPDWDFMQINKGMKEFDCCTCFDKQHIHES